MSTSTSLLAKTIKIDNNLIHLTVNQVQTETFSYFVATIDDGLDKLTRKFNSMKAIQYWSKAVFQNYKRGYL